MNSITLNGGPGVLIKGSTAEISRNNIFDNKTDIMGEPSGATVNAKDNWWGNAKAAQVLSNIKGRIDVSSILDAPIPEGKSVKIPVLAEIPESVNADSYLLLSFSPYRVKKDMVISGGATLYIEPGVVLEYDQRTSIVVKNGGVSAKGTKELPIIFTASGSNPSPGFYKNAVSFTEKTSVNSFFEYCIMGYSETALDIHFGSPEISFCSIFASSQSGVFCRNDASPKITYNSFTENKGEGAIKCVGMSRPNINYNNFEGNSVAIQAFSSIVIDARHNWWGKAPPDVNLIWGDASSVNTESFLEAPEPKAFVAGKKSATEALNVSGRAK